MTNLGFQLGEALGSPNATPADTESTVLRGLVGAFVMGGAPLGGSPEIVTPTARESQNYLEVEIDLPIFGPTGNAREAQNFLEIELDFVSPKASVAQNYSELEIDFVSPKASLAQNALEVEIDRPISLFSGGILRFIEPGFGLRTRTDFLDENHPMNITMMTGQRATANITLIIKAGSSFQPAEGWPTYIYEGDLRLFAGTIDTIDITWLDDIVGYLSWSITCVSYEQCLDSPRLRPQAFTNMTCGQIVTAVMGQFPALPIALGDIQDGVTLTSFPVVYQRLTDLIDTLASQSGFIWGVDPSASTPALYFRQANIVPAPFTFTSDLLLWLTSEQKVTRTDFRDRQIITASFSAFAPSVELFVGNDVTTIFTLRSPVDHVVSVVLTTGTQSAVTGTFTGQPNPADTVTVGQVTYQFVTTLDNTQFGQILIGATFADTAQNMVDCIMTTGSLAGLTFSLPTWENFLANAFIVSGGVLRVISKATGADGQTLRIAASAANFSWTSGGGSSGSAPPGSLAQPLLTAYATFTEPNAVQPQIFDGDTITLNGTTYTFKTTINNAIANEIHIDSTLNLTPISGYSQGVTQTVYNMIDAINGNPATAGTAYSSATTPNTLYQFSTTPSAGGFSGLSKLPITQVALYALTTASPTLSTSSGSPARFAWQLVTSPGTSSTGSSSGTTSGTAIQNSDVLWSQGSNLVTIKTAPPVGTSVLITYYRLGANCIAVEDTTLVTARALIETGTGRYDQMVDDSQNTDPWNALAKAQAYLEQYATLPKEISFETYKPGLVLGDLLNINLVRPTGAPSLLNGNWLIQSINADYVPALDMPVVGATGGVFKFKVTVISTDVLATYIKFWELLAQVGPAAGAGGGSGALATSSSSSGGSASAISGNSGDLPVYGLNNLVDSGVPLSLLIAAIGGLPRTNTSSYAGAPIFVFIG